MASDRRPLRVLHAVGNMNRGGTETWLMHLLRFIDRNAITFDFLVNEDREYHYSEEIRQLGSRLIVCPSSASPWRFSRSFRKVISNQDSYQILHAHKHTFNSLILHAGRQAGIPVRIAHSHTDTRQADTRATLLRKAYLGVSRAMISRYATHGIGCSDAACCALFGNNWQTDERWQILECGLSFDRFSQSFRDPTFRLAFGYTAEHFVVGHVGRFDDIKNQGFLLNVFSQLSSRIPQARLVLVGHGPGEATIRQQIHKLNLNGVTQVLLNRGDVPELMTGVFDVFAFPSRYEGLGLALVEAQAAGLPCLVSDHVPVAATVVDHLVTRLPITGDGEEWANRLLQISRNPIQHRCSTAIDTVRSSRYAIECSGKALVDQYLQIAERDTLQLKKLKERRAT